MALVGHKLTHIPQLVHCTKSIICGLRFFPSSRAPCGQTPMQIWPVHGWHFERSIVIEGLGSPMGINN